MSKYAAEWTQHALVQLLALRLVSDLTGDLQLLNAMVNEFASDGPIGLASAYDSDLLFDLGLYTCGRAHEFETSRIYAAIVIRDGGRRLIVLEVCPL